MGFDTDSGEVVAFDLTDEDVDEASHLERLRSNEDKRPRPLQQITLLIRFPCRRRARQKSERRIHRSSAEALGATTATTWPEGDPIARQMNTCARTDKGPSYDKRSKDKRRSTAAGV